METQVNRYEPVTIHTLHVKVVEGMDLEKSFESKSDALTIGRDPGNDLVLSDRSISEHHVRLQRRTNGIFVEDLNSSNGTWIGTIRIEKATLKLGSKLRLGKKTIIQIKDGKDYKDRKLSGDILGDIRGCSDEMKLLMAQVEKYGKTDAPIMILGENGTGKSLFAETMHKISPRQGPFIIVDLGRLAPGLIESELFGHVKGAFNGATSDKVGYCEAANKGTLFLDEIGNLTLEQQKKLLELTYEKKITPVGSTRVIELDIRIICATNCDLVMEINRGNFRKDLFYRLSMIKLIIPPLGERPDDIPILIEHFLDMLDYNGGLDEFISTSTLEFLKEYSWPGNARELRHVVERLKIDPDWEKQLPQELEGEKRPIKKPIKKPIPHKEPLGSIHMPIDKYFSLPWKQAKNSIIEEFEYRYLLYRINCSEGNKTHAAKEAGISPSLLHRVIKKYEKKHKPS